MSWVITIAAVGVAIAGSSAGYAINASQEAQSHQKKLEKDAKERQIAIDLQAGLITPDTAKAQRDALKKQFAVEVAAQKKDTSAKLLAAKADDAAALKTYNGNLAKLRADLHTKAISQTDYKTAMDAEKARRNAELEANKKKGRDADIAAAKALAETKARTDAEVAAYQAKVNALKNPVTPAFDNYFTDTPTNGAQAAQNSLNAASAYVPPSNNSGALIIGGVVVVGGLLLWKKFKK